MTVEIANLALDRCAVPPIRSLEQTDSTTRTVNRHMERSIDWILRRRFWSSLLTVDVPAKASPEANALPPKFNHAYHVPTGFVRLYRVYQGEDEYLEDDDWRVIKANGGTGAQHMIITRIEATQIEFVHRPDDLNSLTESLKDLIALKLAMNLIIPLKVTENRRKEIEGEYTRVLGGASDEDGSQDQEDIDWAGGDITNSRLGPWGNRDVRG